MLAIETKAYWPYLNLMKLYNINVLQHHEWMKNKHQPLCSSVCFIILQGSGSLFSLRNSVFADHSSSWCFDSLCTCNWWEHSAYIGELLWAELHWWCAACCGRSFTDWIAIRIRLNPNCLKWFADKTRFILFVYYVYL